MALERIVQGGVTRMARDHQDRRFTVSVEPGLVVDANDTQLDLPLASTTTTVTFGSPKRMKSRATTSSGLPAISE